MNNNYAPIFVKVYNRRLHFIECIESLKKCRLAKESILYIASDAAATHSHVDEINKIREYIYSIDGFKEVIPIIRSKNYGRVENGYDAKDFIYKNHDKLIMMEDDVVVGKGFLEFMNYGLEQFAGDKDVIAVAGYLPSDLNGKYQDPFLINLFSPYGIGVWRSKEERIQKLRKIENYKMWLRDKTRFKLFESAFPELVRALPLVIDGGEILGDVEHNFIMQYNDMAVLFPPVSISKSIGFDGSGLHSGVNEDLQKENIADDVFINFNKASVNKYRYAENRGEKKSPYRPLTKLLNYILYYSMLYWPAYYAYFMRVRHIYKNKLVN